ncbi:hypothetical protein C8F04DRAFT_1134744 [Mycena alexandri]|uniref:Uncharacterized protein n=1 Tax=Mycena alexandri TaxID=1745969 RepID=A0AAD6S990_9AGAR|nr:hypothetical protein C8F04DRAFT_1134744 [Mycena alexandri]
MSPSRINTAFPHFSWSSHVLVMFVSSMTAACCSLGGLWDVFLTNGVWSGFQGGTGCSVEFGSGRNFQTRVIAKKVQDC